MFSSIAWLMDSLTEFGNEKNNPLVKLKKMVLANDMYRLLLSMLSTAFGALALLADPSLIVIPTPETFESYVRSMVINEPYKTIIKVILLVVYTIIMALNIESIGVTPALKVILKYVFNKYLKDMIINYIKDYASKFFSF